MTFLHKYSSIFLFSSIIAFLIFILSFFYEIVDNSKLNLARSAMLSFSFGSFAIYLYFRNESSLIKFTRRFNKLIEENIELESKIKQYTFLKLDKHLISSIHQYLVFFSNYVKDSKKVDITMHASEVEGGLDIAFDFPESVTKEELQTWLDEYLGFLTTDKNELQVNTVAEVTEKEADILILKLKNQKQYFEHSLEILRMENRLLKSENEHKKDVIKLLASKSDQIFIPIGDNNSLIKEQTNTTDKPQFIGNTFQESNINISEINDTIIDLIKTYAENNKQQTQLLSNLKTLQSETASEKKKKKSGGMIRKFLETCNTEVAKKVIQTISKNGEGWVQYIIGLF